MISTPHSSHHKTDLQAIGYALAGFTFWVLTDTAIKLVGQSGLPPYESVAFLGLVMAIFMSIYCLVRGQRDRLRPHRISRQLGRACLDMTNNLCVVIALRHLSLTLFYILIFLAPIVVSLLSAIFLREGLGWKRSLAILTGFSGVIVAVHPWSTTHEGDWVGYAACMVCVASFSTNMVWARVLTQSETPESLTVFSGIVTAAVGFALMIAHRAAPINLAITVESLAMGIFCALGALCFYIAVKHTSAANVSQYHYTQLLTGTLLSYLIWHYKPSLYVVLGGILILTAGLYIAFTAHSDASTERP